VELDYFYDAAVTAVLIEGAIFVFLAVTGIRYAIVKLIPNRSASPLLLPLGLLTHLGLKLAEGLGIIVSDIATAVTLGACHETTLLLWPLLETCPARTNSLVSPLIPIPVTILLVS
jgi:AGZA family xanthine/uracil permease-like MFS transporter